MTSGLPSAEGSAEFIHNWREEMSNPHRTLNLKAKVEKARAELMEYMEDRPYQDMDEYKELVFALRDAENDLEEDMQGHRVALAGRWTC